jgi:hypothetical protein
VAQTPTTIRFEPQSIQINHDQTITSTIDVIHVENLYSVDIELRYDPAVVEVVDADADQAGVQVAWGSALVDKQFYAVENQAGNGVIKFAGTFINPKTAFDGDGSLLEISWQAKNATAGRSALTISRAIMVDADNQPIETKVQNGEFYVGSPLLLTGHVTRQGLTDHSGVTVSTGQEKTQTGSDGYFEIEGFTPYRFTFSSTNYLTVLLEGQASSTELTTYDVGTVSLLGGDVTGDNQINIFDLSLIGSSYDKYNAQVDLNADGKINIFDLAISAGNYGRVGAFILEHR